jgi:hypothetical protein
MPNDMTRTISILLLFSYLASFTEFSEVLRVPLLIEHYMEHKSQVSEMSFVEFLAMHYETDVAHDDKDHELPFKDCSHSLCCQSVVLPAQKISLTANPITVAQVHTSYYLLHKPEVLSGDIFQPPKI